MSNSDQCRVVGYGVDTLWMTYTGQPNAAQVEIAEVLQKRARAYERKETSEPAPPMELLFHPWKVSASEPGAWRFLLKHPHGVDVAFALRSPSESRPCLRIRVGSAACWALGPSRAGEFCQLIASELLNPATMQGRVSRVDFCCDFQGWDVNEHDKGLFVGRMRSIGCHTTEHEPDDLGWIACDKCKADCPAKSGGEGIADCAHKHTESYWKGSKFTGFTFGKSPIRMNIYDKSEEVKKSDKRWFEDIWAKNDEFEPGKRVMRIEVQLRREVLSTFRRYDGEVGLTTVSEVMEHARSLWMYMLGKWLRHVRVGTTGRVRDWPTSEPWKVLQGCAWNVRDDEITRERQREASLDALMPMLVGLAAHAAALTGQPLEELDWETSTMLLSGAVGKYLKDKGKLWSEMVARWSEQRKAKKTQADELAELDLESLQSGIDPGRDISGEDFCPF